MMHPLTGSLTCQPSLSLFGGNLRSYSFAQISRGCPPMNSGWVSVFRILWYSFKHAGNSTQQIGCRYQGQTGDDQYRRLLPQLWVPLMDGSASKGIFLNYGLLLLMAVQKLYISAKTNMHYITAEKKKKEKKCLPCNKEWKNMKIITVTIFTQY